VGTRQAKDGKRTVRPGYPDDRPLHLRSRLTAMAAGAICAVVAVALARFPAAAELYATAIGPVVVGGLSRLSGIVPFALGEWVLLGFLARQLLGAGRGLVQVLRRRRTARNAAVAGMLRLGSDLGIVLTLFYVLWGFHYARAPLEERLGWTDESAPTAAELSALAEEMVAAGNDAYLELHGVADVGEPTARPDDPSSLERAIDEAWRTVPAAAGMPRIAERRYGRVKRPLTSRVLCYLGIEGYFSPFTGEANVNALTPAVSLPHSLAHEKAHQRGFAPEDEANFMGYLVAAAADDPLARYSAYVFAQRQLLGALRRLDPEAQARIVEGRLPGVRRDIEDERDFWMSYYGPGTRVARSANDLYLRSNRVEGGILSYGMSLRLLLEYSRERGGTLTEGKASGPSRL
jgi:hypothetical protein